MIVKILILILLFVCGMMLLFHPPLRLFPLYRNTIFELLPYYSYDVSGNDSSSVTGVLKIRDGRVVIDITGSGEMKNIAADGVTAGWYRDLVNMSTGWMIDPEKVVINDGVLSIGAGAFSGCGKLQDVEICSDVKRIGRYAFADCNSLQIIRYSGTKKEWEEIHKEDHWRHNSPISSIQCSDGIISISDPAE